MWRWVWYTGLRPFGIHRWEEWTGQEYLTLDFRSRRNLLAIRVALWWNRRECRLHGHAKEVTHFWDPTIPKGYFRCEWCYHTRPDRNYWEND